MDSAKSINYSTDMWSCSCTSTKRGQGSQTLNPILAKGFVVERRCNFAKIIHAPRESARERERERGEGWIHGHRHHSVQLWSRNSRSRFAQLWFFRFTDFFFRACFSVPVGVTMHCSVSKIRSSVVGSSCVVKVLSWWWRCRRFF
jgi:hypothetical protein